MQRHTTTAGLSVHLYFADSRRLLRAYAAVTFVVGVSMTGTGIRGTDRLPLAHESLIWISGMVLVAAGCAASGLALNDDPSTRRRALLRFAIGHLLVGAILWMQWGVYWRWQGLPLAVALAPLAAGLVMLAIEIAARPPDVGLADATTSRRLRSTYDEHIRQIARREERARLARDLHDAVKQQLFVIQTAAATAEARFDTDADSTRGALTQVRTAAREAATEMAALLDELQAAPLENTGLVEALKKQCEALAIRTGAVVNFTPGTMPPPGTLSPGAHDAIYRIAQEALANVARHARATLVDISLQTDATQLELRIADNGSGFDPRTRRSGMGISNMERRAGEIGGHLRFAARATGVEVVLKVPVTTRGAMSAVWGTAAVLGFFSLNWAVVYLVLGDVPQWWSLLLAPISAWGVWHLMIVYGRRRLQP